jgi:hypothetical protein
LERIINDEHINYYYSWLKKNSKNKRKNCNDLGKC